MHTDLTFPNYLLTLANTLWHAFCSVPQLRLFNTFNIPLILLKIIKLCYHPVNKMFHVER